MPAPIGLVSKGQGGRQAMAEAAVDTRGVQRRGNVAVGAGGGAAARPEARIATTLIAGGAISENLFRLEVVALNRAFGPL
ncbi:MAG: hypothetical protein RLN70_10550 [Rhodospirillaceae bacterium]